MNQMDKLVLEVAVEKVLEDELTLSLDYFAECYRRVTVIERNIQTLKTDLTYMGKRLEKYRTVTMNYPWNGEQNGE